MVLLWACCDLGVDGQRTLPDGRFRELIRDFSVNLAANAANQRVETLAYVLCAQIRCASAAASCGVVMAVHLEMRTLLGAYRSCRQPREKEEGIRDRVSRGGLEWQSQLSTKQQLLAAATFSTGPPSIDHEPGHRNPSVSTAMSRGRVP